MASEASEQMLSLLNELAGLKEIDVTEQPRTPLDAARKERQRRRREIRQQIKELAGAQSGKIS